MEEQASAMSREQEKNVLIRLQEAQSKSGYVSQEDIAAIARAYDMSVSDVYGVATFYSFLRSKPAGRNLIRICQSLPCHLKGGDAVISKLTQLLGVQPGETTPDGRFTLEMTNCIGACDTAPAMLVNGEVVGNLTVESISAILEHYT